MPELYKNEFTNLYNIKKKENFSFFKEETIFIDNEQFKYLVCNIDLSIIKCALELAKEKTKFTMNQNQANIPRDEITKLQKCCQGILAEMFIHFLLVERYGFNVLRYDLERSSFVYSEDEYDLKIYVENDYYEVESRSSNIHHESVLNFVSGDVIIGPYVNSIKKNEELADFHFRPIYMPNFSLFEYIDGKYFYSKKMMNGDVKLIITGVATKEDFTKYGYEKTLGQIGTTYKVVDAKTVGDISEMDKKFNKLYCD